MRLTGRTPRLTPGVHRGVVDGFAPKGVEDKQGKDFLWKIDHEP
jgi:hypothetical protein